MDNSHSAQSMLQTTEAHPFFSCGAPSNQLFSVCEGTPIVDALNQVSCLLSCARKIISATEPIEEEIYGAAYLVEMSLGVVDSVISALEKEPRYG
ncbi:DUF3077 domain-containing protein [Oxalobacter sp. OttesenSCG-928-P03]|nr:DUF3077 domain-containing protein [Oxalobacter sp. OttesenSCG-928-P03]